MSSSRPSFQRKLFRELAIFLVLLLLGLVLLPLAVYIVGNAVFGDYTGGGFSGFYAALHGNLRQGQWAAWYLILSPYLTCQLMRLTLAGCRRLRQSA